MATRPVPGSSHEDTALRRKYVTAVSGLGIRIPYPHAPYPREWGPKPDKETR